MSDYKTSINDLYKQRSRIASLKKDDRRRIKIQQQIDAAVSKLYDDPATDPLLQMNESEPILLFPLRLETRFALSGAELWIRVYPDEIAIQAHETALTASEKNAGAYYWKYLWHHAGGDLAAARKKAWSQVANSFGVNRAKWIFLKTRPVKLGPNEDFSNILTEADLDPGSVETKEQSWSKPVMSYIMPDLLKLRMYIGGNLAFETFGQPIVQPLTVSPDPNGTKSSGDLDWKDTDLAWLEDFDKAVSVGMAFKVILKGIAGYDPKVGFSSIMVMGVRSLFDQSPLAVPPPAAGAAALSTLFDSHQYTSRGLALMSQGTPTNNTEERDSGYSQQPGFSEDKYQQDLQRYGGTTDPDVMEDGRILGAGLGLDPALFQQLENGVNTDHKDASMINKVLYPATLGFYLGDLLHPLFKPQELETLRVFFCSYVTGRGPLPAIRMGPQPYGVLPTSHFGAFRWPSKDKDVKLFQKLTDLLKTLEGDYVRAVPQAPKLGQPDDPHVLLDEILGLYPNSETFYQRIGYSGSFLRNCLGQSIPQNQNSFLEGLITRFSSYAGSAPEGILQLKKIVFERTGVPLNPDKLVDLGPGSETSPVSIPSAVSPAIHHGRNYIQWLADLYGRASFATIERDYFGSTDPRIDPPLLYLLLRHGMLIQLYRCIFHWLSVQGYLAPNLSILSNGTPTANFIACKEYLNFFQKQEDISAMELMLIDAAHLPMLAPGETAVTYLLQNTDAIFSDIGVALRNRIPPEISNDFRHLKEFLSILKYLADLPAARLERAFVEHLDCLTYRLDAWQTGIFYKKLQLNRSAGAATGTVIGAFGWLENVRPAQNVQVMKETDLPAELRPGTGMPIVQADGQGGYVHAPSIIQAKAAALLRDAYLHHHDPGDPDMMAVNLSSERVRKAMDIFEGIQMGHAPGELLGYKLERMLHDQATPLDKYIPVLRGLFPLGGTALANPGNPNGPASTQSGKPAEWVSRLDGLAIVNAIKGGNNYPFGSGQLPAAGAEATAIQAGISELQDTLDAMKGLMVAESIHQLVQGNTDRAGALLKSIHELKPPSVFEFVRTPRTPAEILTHRACIFFKPGDITNPANPWPSMDMTQRANTEPALNEWLGEIIGAPDLIQCTVTEVESRTNGIVSIADLDLQPIDLVYLTPAEWGKEESGFTQRISYYYRVTQQLPEDTEIEIGYDKAEKDHLSFSDVLPLLKMLKEVVTQSRALNAADLDLQQYRGKANVRNLTVDRTAGDVGGLMKRKANVTAEVELKIKKLKDALSATTGAVCAGIRECLIDCCDLELQGAFPSSSVGESQELKDVLVAQSERVIGEMRKMVSALNAVVDIDADKLVQSFAIVFGPAFKILPVFHFTKNEDDEIDRLTAVQDAYKAEDDIFRFITSKTNMSSDRLLQHWMNEMIQLRPKLASLEWCRTLYDTLQEKQLGLHVMQLPYETGDSWLGLEYPADMQTGKGKLSVLAHHFPDTVPDWKADFCGLLLDEWVEEIPGDEEQTGISFQYNQPNSQPPQTLLLAISPTEGKKWSWDTLGDIINDTLRRAKQRAIGTRELAGTDWMGSLPGAPAEFSYTKANVSLFFRN